MIRVTRILPLRCLPRIGWVRVEGRPKHRSKGLGGSIMKILGLLAHSILASICQATLDASLTRSLIAY